MDTSPFVSSSEGWDDNRRVDLSTPEILATTVTVRRAPIRQICWSPDFNAVAFNPQSASFILEQPLVED